MFPEINRILQCASEKHCCTW